MTRMLLAWMLALVLLAACSSETTDTSTSSPLPASTSLSPDTIAFCNHANGQMLEALNRMSEGAASDIQPTLDALSLAADAFRGDLKSTDPRVKSLAKQFLAGIDQTAAMIRSAGTLNVISSRGIGDKLTSATIALGDVCPSS